MGVIWTLLFGRLAQFTDGGHGRLCSIHLKADGLDIAGLTVAEKLRHRQVYVPAQLVTAAFAAGLHVDAPWESLATKSPPSGIRLFYGQPVQWQAPGNDRTHLKGVIAVGEPRRLRALLLRQPLGRIVRLPVDQAYLSDSVTVVHRDAPPLSLLPRRRSDSDIRSAVLIEIAKERLLFPEDRRYLSVNVVDAVVSLGGNVRSWNMRRNVVQRASQVPGVLSVVDGVVEDEELEVAVATALAREPATHRLLLYVSAAAGDVELAGNVPDEEAALSAVRAARSVPGVRAVTSSLMWPSLGKVLASEVRGQNER